jgi:hypothetical protein
VKYARALLLLVVLAAPAFATEVLVLTSATRVDTGSLGRRGFEIQNLGPNDIWCELGPSGTVPVVSKSRKVAASGGTWSASAKSTQWLYCIASTASQLTAAATIYIEVY